MPTCLKMDEEDPGLVSSVELDVMTTLVDNTKDLLTQVMKRVWSFIIEIML
jgi:hypothetical protein